MNIPSVLYGVPSLGFIHASLLLTDDQQAGVARFAVNRTSGHEEVVGDKDWASAASGSSRTAVPLRISFEL
jgi:hypothetical protein